MSAAVLRDPSRIQTIEDDRESAVHVLTLLALRHVNHDELDHIASYLSVYNQFYHCLSDGIVTGGLYKGDRFASSMFPTFTSDPLNRIFSVLNKTFSARYTEAYSDEAIKQARDVVAQAERNPAMDPTIMYYYYQLAPYIYGSRLEALVKPKWLVEVLNEHLESDDWPSCDKAAVNSLN